MRRALFLFDTTGYAALPFTKLGWHTTIVDILNVGERATNENVSEVLSWDILEKEADLISIARECELVIGFPPCTDLAVSGARHFSVKALENPNFQQDAVYLARSVERIAEAANTAWALENPVSVLSTLWRKPDFWFHPYQYGGYLPENDQHPDWPEYIAPRDAYEKKTCIWHSFDFIVPPVKPVDLNYYTWSTQHHKLGGKSQKTKMIRSASPRGFFTALAEEYSQ